MIWSDALTNLRDVLANLYKSSERVAEQAGLPSEHISSGGKPIDTWHSTLKEAQKQNKVQAIIDVARAEYPENENLARACRAYVSQSPPERLPGPFSIRLVNCLMHNFRGLFVEDLRKDFLHYAGLRELEAAISLEGVPEVFILRLVSHLTTQRPRFKVESRKRSVEDGLVLLLQGVKYFPTSDTALLESDIDTYLDEWRAILFREEAVSESPRGADFVAVRAHEVWPFVQLTDDYFNRFSSETQTDFLHGRPPRWPDIISGKDFYRNRIFADIRRVCSK